MQSANTKSKNTITLKKTDPAPSKVKKWHRLMNEVFKSEPETVQLIEEALIPFVTSLRATGGGFWSSLPALTALLTRQYQVRDNSFTWWGFTTARMNIYAAWLQTVKRVPELAKINRQLHRSGFRQVRINPNHLPVLETLRENRDRMIGEYRGAIRILLEDFQGSVPLTSLRGLLIHRIPPAAAGLECLGFGDSNQAGPKHVLQDFIATACGDFAEVRTSVYGMRYAVLPSLIPMSAENEAAVATESTVLTPNFTGPDKSFDYGRFLLEEITLNDGHAYLRYAKVLEAALDYETAQRLYGIAKGKFAAQGDEKEYYRAWEGSERVRREMDCQPLEKESSHETSQIAA